jgi:hypothetical protein
MTTVNGASGLGRAERAGHALRPGPIVAASIAALADLSAAAARGVSRTCSSTTPSTPLVVLLAAIDRRRERLDSARTVTRLFDASTLFFFVPYVAQEAALSLLSEGKPLTHLATRLRNWPPFFIFVDFVLLSRCFESLYALGIVRAQIVRERHRRELESEMLGLRLELERQRLASIRAQLEPHFLFNALNATSGLVRTEERAATIIPGSLRPSESLRSAARAGHHARS